MEQPPPSLDTSWRRLATAMFEAPRSSRILVRISCTAEPLEAYLDARPERRFGVLPFVLAAAARSLAHDVPALNGVLVRGRVVQRPDFTVTLTTPLPGQVGLVPVRLREAHQQAAHDVETVIHDRLTRNAERYAHRGAPPEYVLARIPWPLRRGLFRAMRGLATLGLPMGRFDLAPESMGAIIVTNLEPLGRGIHDRDVYEGLGDFESAFVPQFQGAREATMIAVLPVRPMVVVHGGVGTVQRRLTLCFTFDHRLADGSHIGRFIEALGRRLVDPEMLDRPLHQPAFR